MQQLADLRDAMDQAGVAWWVNSGTLLGIIRDERILSWDSDLDVDCWAGDGEWRRLPPLLKAAGYRVSIRQVAGVPYGLLARRRGALPVSIHLWRCQGGRAWSAQTDERRNPYRRPTLRWLVFGVLRRTASYLQHRWGLLDRCVPCRRIAQRVVGYRVGTWWVPASLFRDLKRVTVDGIEVSVPARYEEVLELRYGDWRTPVIDWDYVRDDATYHPVPPPACSTDS